MEVLKSLGSPEIVFIRTCIKNNGNYFIVLVNMIVCYNGKTLLFCVCYQCMYLHIAVNYFIFYQKNCFLSLRIYFMAIKDSLMYLN